MLCGDGGLRPSRTDHSPFPDLETREEDELINGTLYRYALLAPAAYHFRQSLPDFLIWHPL